MKNFLILTFCLLSFLSPLIAQDAQSAYTEAMGSAIATLFSGRSAENLQDAANRFERIAAQEPENWLPLYYQAYAKLSLAMLAAEQQEDTAGDLLDEAQALVDRLKELQPEESEVHALQGYLYQGRIIENPMAGAVFSPQSVIACRKAIDLNPDNPRPYFLIGQNYFHMPEAFGGGHKAAKDWLEKADQRFTSYEAPSGLHPDWGKRYNDYMLEQVRKAESGE
jgi:tetratricopeptide (TPR) repeat protein